MFEIIDALSREPTEAQAEAFLGAPGADLLLAERPDLIAVLRDREALAALPEGSFGRTYLAFMERGGHCFLPDRLLSGTRTHWKTPPWRVAHTKQKYSM